MQLEGDGNKKGATRVERTSYGENVSRNGLYPMGRKTSPFMGRI